jgi:cation transport regulator ChaC
MPISVKFKGVEYRCATAKEAAELGRLLARRNGPTEHGERRAPKATASEEDRTKRALMFLEAIREAGPAGISSKALAAKIGIEDARGLGMIFAMLERSLEEIGGSPVRDVIARIRNEDGERIWKMRDRTQMNLALKSLGSDA